MVRVRDGKAVLSASRARKDAERARRYRQKLPRDHPYAKLPVWVPFCLARRVAPLIARRGR